MPRAPREWFKEKMKAFSEKEYSIQGTTKEQQTPIELFG